MPEPFSRTLETALSCIREEVPDIHHMLGACVGPRRIGITVHGPPLVLSWSRGWSISDPTPMPVHVEARTTPAAIQALISGQDCLEDAVLEGRVHLRGELDDLLALDQAITLFVQGAVRAPGMIHVLQHWEDSLRPEEE